MFFIWNLESNKWLKFEFLILKLSVRLKHYILNMKKSDYSCNFLQNIREVEQVIKREKMRKMKERQT